MKWSCFQGGGILIDISSNIKQQTVMLKKKQLCVDAQATDTFTSI